MLEEGEQAAAGLKARSKSAGSSTGHVHRIRATARPSLWVSGTDCYTAAVGWMRCRVIEYDNNGN